MVETTSAVVNKNVRSFQLPRISIVQALRNMPLNVGFAQSIMLARPRTGLVRVGRIIVMLGISIVWRIEIKQLYFHIFSLSQ